MSKKKNEDYKFGNLNEEKLAEALDIEVVEEEVAQIQKDLSINTRRSSTTNPDQLLVENIDRANRILDILENNAEKDQVISARQAEVMAQLINAVTNAANSIISEDYNKEYLQIRKSVLLLRSS